MTATRSRSRSPAGIARRIDPRLAARRSSVARSEGLRRLWITGGLTLVTSVAVLAIALLNSSWLDIDQVNVVGAERSDPQQIVTASGIVAGEPLVELDASGAEARVEEVPWVAGAAVSRSWTGDVTIEVVERVGVVALPTGSRFALVDRTGRQVEVVDQRPDGFFPVTGLEESGVPGQPVSTDGQLVVSLVTGLSPSVAGVTRAIGVHDGRLMLELASGGQANLGDDRDLPAKLLALETVLARVDLSCIEVIDVRVPSAPTVRRGGAVATAEAAGEEPFPDQGGC